MKIIRLEAVNPNRNDKDIVNKVLVFDPIHCILKGYRIPEIKLAFDESDNSILRQLAQFGININKSNDRYRIIHNLPVKQAYSSPLKIFMDITTNCHLSCKYCLSFSSPTNSINLPIDLCEKIISEMGKVGVFMVKIGGGEPLLHKDFWSIIKLLKNNNIFTSLSTSGIDITDDIAQQLKEYNIKISVSLEGTEDTNDKLRGAGSYQAALSAIKILKNYYGNEIYTRTNVTPFNFGDIPAIVKLAKKFRIKAKFNFLRPTGRVTENTNLLINFSDAAVYLEILKFLNHPQNAEYVILDEAMMFNQPQGIKDLIYGRKICGAAAKSMHISSDGSVSPCIFMGDNYQHGRIIEDGSLIEFWKGEINGAFISMRNIHEPKECINCERLCKYECPAMRNFFSNGNPSGQDSVCLKGILERVARQEI